MTEQERIAEMEELLRSACAIAERNGEGTKWERFINSIKAIGLNGVTARTYRILEGEEGEAFGLICEFNHKGNGGNMVPVLGFDTHEQRTAARRYLEASGHAPIADEECEYILKNLEAAHKDDPLHLTWFKRLRQALATRSNTIENDAPKSGMAKYWYDKYKAMKKSMITAWQITHEDRNPAPVDFKFPASTKPDVIVLLNGDVQIVDKNDEDAPLVTVSGHNGVKAEDFFKAIMENR